MEDNNNTTKGNTMNTETYKVVNAQYNTVLIDAVFATKEEASAAADTHAFESDSRRSAYAVVKTAAQYNPMMAGFGCLICWE